MQNNSLVKTFCYFDLFGYPLTLSEVVRYSIEEKMEKNEARKLLMKHPAIEEKEGYYFLKGRSHLVSLRKIRQKCAHEKRKYAKGTIQLLSKIPTIKAIALSGSVSCGNARLGDDIDLFIITSANRVWITRLFVYSLLTFMGKLRKMNDIDNKFCPNMFVSEDDLLILDQNLYTASEIIHLIPVYEKENAFGEFVKKNRWISTFFPNFPLKYSKKETAKSPGLFSKGLFVFEFLAFVLQYSVMSRKITNEKILLTRIEFHPNQISSKILPIWKARYGVFASEIEVDPSYQSKYVV